MLVHCSSGSCSLSLASSSVLSTVNLFLHSRANSVLVSGSLSLNILYLGGGFFILSRNAS